ncbi:MAG: hypothetical protein MUF20_12015 [Methylotetracoccus sp.]|nr:hypothetical protein [Methylotetracoccus sp.]
MTAYARVESERREGALIWELRSVNHRFVDVALKMPEALRFLEIEARNRIGVRLRRGRIECTLTWKSIGKSAESIRLNSGLISALLSAAANVEDLSERPMVAVTPFDVLRWPGVLEEAEVDREATGTEAIQLLDVLLDQAVATREAEGLNLAAVMKERLDRIEQYTAQAKRRAPEIRMAQRQKLEHARGGVPESPRTSGSNRAANGFFAAGNESGSEYTRIEIIRRRNDRCRRRNQGPDRTAARTGAERRVMLTLHIPAHSEWRRPHRSSAFHLLGRLLVRVFCSDGAACPQFTPTGPSAHW